MSEEQKEIKRWHWIAVGLIITVAIFYKLYTVYYWPKAIIRIGGEEFQVLVADNEKHRFRGWSGEKDMGKYGGMLLLFFEDSNHLIVMRDMNFPLDIVWLNDGVVVDIAKNVHPEPGVEEDDLTLYFTSYDSDAVLELPAGFKERTGLERGDRIEIIKK